MPHAKPAAAITAVATILCGCGAVVKPPQGRGHIENPRGGQLQCLLAHHLPAVAVGGTGIQIGALPAGPTVQFEPSNGAAETLKVEGQAQGAEMIGSALLYPHQAPDSELSQIESCVDHGMH